MNEKLIRETVKYLEEHPNEWDQETYGVTADNRTRKYLPYGERRCFFGTALVLAEAEPKEILTFTDARNLLGLDFSQAWKISEFMTENINELKAMITEQTGVTFDA